jgi:hypothetical protein
MHRACGHGTSWAHATTRIHRKRDAGLDTGGRIRNDACLGRFAREISMSTGSKEQYDELWSKQLLDVGEGQ